MIHGFDDSTKEKVSLLNFIYPVGSIYMSVNTTSPATLFGGTWEAISGRFLLASGGGYANGTTGGEATHKLTVAEMPNHTHEYNTFVNVSHNFHEGTSDNAINALDSTHGPNTLGTGGNQAHNNMPPYLVVNVWKRTA